MANSTSLAPSSALLGTTSGSGSNSTTKAAVFGYILGLATAGILYLVSGKGKRSNGSTSAVCPEPHDEPNLLLPPSPAVDAHDGVTEVEEPTPALTGQRKLTDEDVVTIRAMKDGGKPVKEIATLYGVSPKTIYARMRLKKNSNHQKQNESQDEYR